MTSRAAASTAPAKCLCRSGLADCSVGLTPVIPATTASTPDAGRAHRLADSRANLRWNSAVSSRPVILQRMSEQVSRGGRPRKWANEAERKRAYRQRRAGELADPLELRESARAARAEAAASQSAAKAARRGAERWRAKASASDKRALEAENRAARARAAARRAFAERDEARRLLRRKLQFAKHAEGLRADPTALLVLVAELYQELANLRKELASARQRLWHSDRVTW